MIDAPQVVDGVAGAAAGAALAAGACVVGGDCGAVFPGAGAGAFV